MYDLVRRESVPDGVAFARVSQVEGVCCEEKVEVDREKNKVKSKRCVWKQKERERELT